MTPFREKLLSVQLMGVRTRDGRFAHEVNGRAEQDIESYRRVRAEGSQPKGTDPVWVEQAKRESDKLGRPYRADRLYDTYAGPGAETPVSWTTLKEQGRVPADF